MWFIADALLIDLQHGDFKVLIAPDPNKPIKELLEAVQAGAIEGFNNKSSVLAIAPFASLLVRLSADADKTAQSINERTDRLIKLTRWLVLWGVAAFGTSVAVLWIEWLKH